MNVIGDVHIDASSDAASSTPRETKKPIQRVLNYARKHTAKFVFEVGVGVCVLALGAWLGLGSSATTSITKPGPGQHLSPYGSRTEVPFTVENTARSGVWALVSPVMKSFSGHGEPPPNAARWLANDTEVGIRCARPGTTYELRLGGQPEHWRFFGELEDGTYMAMAGFRQTTEDGAQHLIRCEGR